MSTQQPVGRAALRQYLAQTCSRLESSPDLDAEKLRGTVAPQVAESVLRLSKGAPAETRTELERVLREHGVLPECTADGVALLAALRRLAALVGGDDTAERPRPDTATLASAPASQAPGGDGGGSPCTFRHVFTPRHIGRIEDYFELGEALGEGSYGKIFRAKTKVESEAFHLDADAGFEPGQSVRAVKAISSEVTPKRFELEVQVQKELDHPNIAKLFEVFKDKLNYYLVLEMCTGGDLFSRVVEAGGTFCENACARYMRQLLNALNYLHGRSMAHRDLKPENLMLQNEAEGALLKVIDFGCARTFSPNKAMTTSLGTPLYIAPEVLDRNYTEKVDIWSCGVIMYMILIGDAPFMGPNEQELLRAISSGRFEYPGDDDDPSEHAQDMINQMLLLDSGERPSAEALLNHAWLGEHIHEGRGRELPPRLVPKLRKFRRKSQFKKIALELAAQLVKDEDIREMQSTFIELDSDQNGTLTQAEIAEGLRSHGVTLPADLDEIVSELDTDGSGSVDYTEFIASTLSRKQYLRESVLWSVFRTFDLDGDGKIQRDEFEQVVSMSNHAAITETFEEADLNGDHVIDFSEFCKVMRDKDRERVPALAARRTASKEDGT